MEKIRNIAFLLLVSVIMVTGCSEEKLDANIDTVYIEGAEIIGALVEPFDKPYYNRDELQGFVESELALYNSEIGYAGIIVNNFELTNQAAKLYLKYNSYVDYANFNDLEFFVGTINEALAAGYKFDEAFVDYSKLTKVSKEDVLEKTKNKVLITDEDTLIQVNGTILYISDNVQEKNKKSAQLTGEKLSYIIYK